LGADTGGQLMGISSFTGGRRSRVERFGKAAKGKTTQRELRELEEHLLEPEPIPRYTGEQPPVQGVAARSVKLVFPTEQATELFRKYFSVTQYVEQCCYRLDMLTLFLEALEEGMIVYEDEAQMFTFAKRRYRKGKSRVGGRKRRVSVRTRHR